MTFDLSLLLRRVGVPARCDLKMALLTDDTIPESTRMYLRPENPRLQELRKRYVEVVGDWTEPSQWTNEFVRTIPLQAFRGDTAYLWQLRDYNFPIHYLCTHLFLANSLARDLLQMCTEDDLFGIQYEIIGDEYVTRDRLDSVCELEFLRRVAGIRLDSDISILDVGSGYGRFAHRLTQCFPRSKVFCADVIPESAFICEFYLQFRNVSPRAQIIELPDIERMLAETRIDLAVAINSFSECSAEAVTWWLALLRKYMVPKLFVVSHSGNRGGRVMSIKHLGKDIYVDTDELISSAGFAKIQCSRKYSDPLLQQCGVSPTYYHFYEASY